MNRDARQIFLKRLHIRRATLFIFGRSYFIRALVPRTKLDSENHNLKFDWLHYIDIFRGLIVSKLILGYYQPIKPQNLCS